jgi:hypothetical protein
MLFKIEEQKFPLGIILVTAGVDAVMRRDKSFADFVYDSLRRHAKGDWGDLGEEDIEENELSLREGFRLLSAYKNGENEEDEIWIITEADRSSTTVLFPIEY